MSPSHVFRPSWLVCMVLVLDLSLAQVRSLPLRDVCDMDKPAGFGDKKILREVTATPRTYLPTAGSPCCCLPMLIHPYFRRILFFLFFFLSLSSSSLYLSPPLSCCLCCRTQQNLNQKGLRLPAHAIYLLGALVALRLVLLLVCARV